MSFELFPVTQWLNGNANPLAGGKIFTYAAGTTTPLATYTDSTGGTPNANPLVLDAAGRGQLWFNAASYKLVIKDASDVIQQTLDNIQMDNLAATIAGLLMTGDLTMQQSSAATGGANQSSNSQIVQGNYWNGSSSQIDKWTLRNILGTGTNPTSTLTFTHSGASGDISISFGGSVNAKQFEGIRFADQFTAGSTTGGIQEAINDLPASGGTVWLPLGTTTCTSGVTVNKPIIIRGHGSGGFTDVGTNIAYYSCSTIVNATTGSDLFTISLPAGNSLVGVKLQDFSISGNKNVGGSTAGNNISLSGGSSATQIREVIIENLLSYNAKGDGLTIKGNAFMIKVQSSQFVRNFGNGIAVVNNSTGIPSQISFCQVTCDLNTADGLVINGSHVGDVSAWGCIFSECTNGVNVVAGTVNARFSAISCSFESNSNAGVLIKDGYGHYIAASQFPGDSVQLFGVNVDPPGGAGFSLNQITLIANNFGGNVTKDIQFSANLHSGIVFPQAISNYTYLDSSLTAVVIKTDSAGAFTIGSLGGVIPSSAANGSIGSSTVPWNHGFFFGGLDLTETTSPGGTAGLDKIYADSTAHRLMMINNNTSAAPIVGVNGSTSQKSENSADASVLSFTPPAAAGTYRITFALSLSAAAAAVLGWTATWKDSNGNSKSPTNLSLLQVGTAAPALTFTTSTATDEFYGQIIVDVDSSATAIVVKLTLGSGTFTGKASSTIERII